jgi:hypothetical protein
MYEVDECRYCATNGSHTVYHMDDVHVTIASLILYAVTYTVFTIEDLNFSLLSIHHLTSDD